MSSMFGIIVGLLLSGFIGFGLLAYFLAQADVFFTAPREGTAKFVMTGNTVSRMVMAWRKHHATDDFLVIDGQQAVPGLTHYLNPVNWMEPFGIFWIGVWPLFKVHNYDFTWTEEKTDETGKIIPRTRRAVKGDEGQTSIVKLTDTNYFFTADGVKTNEGIPMKFVLLVTTRIENPYKALFSGDDWLQRTGGEIGNAVFRYTGALSYEAVREGAKATLTVYGNATQQEVIVTLSLEEFIKRLGDSKADDENGSDLLTKYGVRIVAAKIHSLDFADGAKQQELTDATIQEYVARQKGLAEKAEAEGKAEAVKIAAYAEKARIDLTYGAIADNADRMRIRGMEALEKSGTNGGNTFIVPETVLDIARNLTKGAGS